MPPLDNPEQDNIFQMSFRDIAPEDINQVSMDYRKVMSAISTYLLSSPDDFELLTVRDQIEAAKEDLARQGTRDALIRLQMELMTANDLFNIDASEGEGEATSSEDDEDYEGYDDYVDSAFRLPDEDYPRERPPGFAKTFEKNPAEEFAELFNQDQIVDILRAFAEQQESLPESVKARLGQVEILFVILSAELSEFDEDDDDERKGVLTTALEEIQTLPAKIMAELDKSINALMSSSLHAAFADCDGDFLVDNFADGKGIIDENGNIREIASIKDLHGQLLTLVKNLRGDSKYANAQRLIEDTLLAPAFNKKAEEIQTEAKYKETYDRLRIEAFEEADRHAKQYYESWITPSEEMVAKGARPLTDREIFKYKKFLRELALDQKLKAEAGKMLYGSDFSDPFEKEIYEQYRNMLDPHDEPGIFADATVDSIVEEIAINVPLIIVSGGVASFARWGLTAGARAFLFSARCASLMRKVGLTLDAANTVVASGRIGRGVLFAGRLTAAGAEALAFDFTHMGIQGELLFKQPGWVRQVLFTGLTLGAFKFTKEQSSILHKFLKENVTKFPDKSFRELMQKVLIHGSTETATMLAVGAVQHGIVVGDFKDYDFAKELFHALLTVGALHIVGAGTNKVIKIGGREFKAMRTRRAENADPSRFLARTGVTDFGGRNPAEVMSEYRAFEKRYRVGLEFFKGRDAKEVARVMAEVGKRMPSVREMAASDWKTLAEADPLTSQILLRNGYSRRASKLTLTDVQEITDIWRRKGVEPTAEVMLGLVKFLKEDIKTVGSAENLRRVAETLIASGNEAFAAMGKRLLRVRPRTVAAGIAILLLLPGCGAGAVPAIAGGVALTAIFGGWGWIAAAIPAVVAGGWMMHRWKKGKPILSTESSLKDAKDAAKDSTGAAGSIRQALGDVAMIVGGEAPAGANPATVAHLTERVNETRLIEADIDREIRALNRRRNSKVRPPSAADLRAMTDQLRDANRRLEAARTARRAAEDALHQAEHPAVHARELTPEATRAIDELIRQYNTAIDGYGHPNEVTALRTAFDRYATALRALYTNPAQDAARGIARADRDARGGTPTPVTTPGRAQRFGGSVPKHSNPPLDIRNITDLQNDVLAELRRLQDSSKFRRSAGNRALQLAVLGSTTIGLIATIMAGYGIVKGISGPTEDEQAETLLEYYDKLGDQVAKDFDGYDQLDEALKTYGSNPDHVRRAFQIIIIKYITGHSAVVEDTIFKENGMPVETLSKYYKKIVGNMIDGDKKSPVTNNNYGSYLGTDWLVTNSVDGIDMSSNSVLISNTGTGSLAETWAFPDPAEKRVRIVN